MPPSQTCQGHARSEYAAGATWHNLRAFASVHDRDGKMTGRLQNWLINLVITELYRSLTQRCATNPYPFGILVNVVKWHEKFLPA